MGFVATLALLNEVAAFNFLDDDFLRHRWIFWIDREIRLLLATAFVLKQPMQNVGEPFVALILKERIVL